MLVQRCLESRKCAIGKKRDPVFQPDHGDNDALGCLSLETSCHESTPNVKQIPQRPRAGEFAWIKTSIHP